jgi:hypothetical protein
LVLEDIKQRRELARNETGKMELYVYKGYINATGCLSRILQTLMTMERQKKLETCHPSSSIKQKQ